MQRRTDYHGDAESHSTVSDLAPNVASPPIPARIAPRWRATHRHSPLEMLQQFPSWLLSLILHLALMLLFASLVVPYGRQTKLEQLFVSFGKGPLQDISRDPIIVETPQAHEKAAEEQVEETEPVEEETDDRPAPPLTTGEPNVDLQKVSKALSDFFRGSAVPKQPDTRMVRIEPVARVESSFDWSAYDENVNRHDEIVEQFIQYDVGNLRGRAGREAARRFQRLGPSAIPALVRGLNRSASIHASCPVGVISSKLVNTLRTTDDPQLIDYALSHLGRDIPRGAPHRKRVLALRNQMQSELRLRNEQIEQRLGQLGWSVDQASVNRIASMYASDASELKSTLLGDDVAMRNAATLSALLRSEQFDTSDQAQLGWAIAELMDRTADQQQLDLLQQTERSLAGSSDLTANMNGSDWRSFWEHRMQVHLMAGLSPTRQIRELHNRDPASRRAVMEAIIESNENISDSLKFQMSDLIIRDLDSDSPITANLARRALVKLAGSDRGGQSAKEWREYWIDTHFDRTVMPRSESHLRQAVFLEQRGKTAAAAKKYRELIESFPGTPAAKSASKRLQSIIRRSRS